MLRNRKAQAILELAILGSLLIMAFSIAVTNGEQYNREQAYLQQTFRGSLKMARKAKAPSSYGTTDFRRSSNVSNPMELGALQQFGGSNQILWTAGKKDPATKEAYKAKAYYRFNRGQVQEFEPAPAPYSRPVTLSSSVSTSPENETRFHKTEQNDQASSQKWMDATDTVSASVPFAGRNVSTADELGDGGFYGGASDSSGIHRSRGLE